MTWCFNPKCGVEAHKTGNRAFPDFDTGIFIRAGDAPTKCFRFRRQPIGGMDLFNRHSSVLRRIKEYDPLVWESLEETLNQQPVVDPSTLETQLKEKTIVLPILQLPAGEEYFLPQPLPAPSGSRQGIEDMKTSVGSGSRREEDLTTDDELTNWPMALRLAESNLQRSTQDDIEISQYDNLLRGFFFGTV